MTDGAVTCDWPSGGGIAVGDAWTWQVGPVDHFGVARRVDMWDEVCASFRKGSGETSHARLSAFEQSMVSGCVSRCLSSLCEDGDVWVENDVNDTGAGDSLRRHMTFAAIICISTFRVVARGRMLCARGNLL